MKKACIVDEICNYDLIVFLEIDFTKMSVKYRQMAIFLHICYVTKT